MRYPRRFMETPISTPYEVEPIEGIPDLDRHRICRRCQKWFDAGAGALMPPEWTGPVGAMRALRSFISQDSSLLRFQCHRCTRIRRATQGSIWLVLLVLIALVLIAEKFGLLR